jgi:holo-[acyl-carrier protein] synthase
MGAAVSTTVGVDLVEIRRIERLLSHAGAADRLLTAPEQAYCVARGNRPARMAARFAAKQALLKALGTGLSGGIRLVLLEVSLSHACEMAIAQAVDV